MPIPQNPAVTTELGGDIVVERGVMVIAADGTGLATDVYRPARNGRPLPEPRPALLERTPYDRGQPPTATLAREAARRGYVFVAQDVRGRGASGGEFKLYLPGANDEGTDGADTMRWIAAQPWCDSRIASIGGSFSAANGQAAALHHPPGLRAAFWRDGGINYRERALRTHGAFNCGLVIPWIIAAALTSPEAQRDPAIAAPLGQMHDNLRDWVTQTITPGTSALALTPAYESLLIRMLEEADDGPIWQSTTARLDGHWDEFPTDVAVLMISGWYAHHAAANLTKLKELGARLHAPVSLIIGPWTHSPGMLEDTTSGDADFGPAAAEFGPAHATLFAWLDTHLPLTETPTSPRSLLHPPLRYFRMGAGDGHKTPAGKLFHGGEWRAADQWPPAGTRLTPLYFQRGGALSTRPPADDGGATSYRFDPRRPCPTVGATNLQDGELFLIGPQDQVAPQSYFEIEGAGGPLAERTDLLTFATAPLTSPAEVTGDIDIVLWCATSAPDTDFVAKLIDVYPPSDDYPHGYAMLLCEDIVRMRYRDDRPTAELLEPGTVYRVRIPVGPTSNVFKTGHRIRIDITSSSCPEYDVNPNTGEPLGRHTRTDVARQTIHHSAAQPSHAMLPLAPAARTNL